MRQFMTTTVEQRKIFSGDFGSHPMEAAWASEAIFFIFLDEVIQAGSELTCKVQVSVDGVHWLDEGTVTKLDASTDKQFLRISHFGGWLRLDCQVSGELKISIHLVLKE